MDLLCTRRVDPVHHSPRTRMYGYFTHELIHLPALAHLVFFLFPTVFVDCLPRPTSAAVSGHAAFAALEVLHSRPSTDRASLATSLLLIGLLTPAPAGDSASPPEVTHCSSVPCHPQTPWCGG